MTDEERIKYYMGKWRDTEITLKKSDFKEFGGPGKIFITSRKNILYPFYMTYVDRKSHLPHLKLSDLHYLMMLGDRRLSKTYILKETKIYDDLPILVKCVNTDHERVGIILKFTRRRHYAGLNLVQTKDLPWKDKQNKVVWRGATTGIGTPRLQQPIHNYKWPVRAGCLPSRAELIRRYGKIYNVGFSEFTEKTHPSWKPFKKKHMTMEEQLTYKYIISLEGNDVASGLKWQLFSNSVVIMPVATRVSWAMEDNLVPYKHYVPVDSSMSNLEAVLDWCGENDDACCEIARNGKKYMEQFLDLEREDRLEKEIIERYAQNVTFV